MKQKALSYLPAEMKSVVNEFQSRCQNLKQSELSMLLKGLLLLRSPFVICRVKK